MTKKRNYLLNALNAADTTEEDPPSPAWPGRRSPKPSCGKKIPGRGLTSKTHSNIIRGMKIARFSTTWTLDDFTDKVRRMTGEGLDRVTVYYWTKDRILRPVLPAGRKRGARYGLEDLLVMFLRARLRREGVSVRRAKESLKTLRDLAPDLLNPTQASKHRLIIFGRKPVLVTRDEIARTLPEGQGVFIFDPSKEIAAVHKIARREAA